MIDLLRNGLKHEKYSIDLFYGTPSPGNDKAALQYAANRFSVTRQFRYSRDETRLGGGGRKPEPELDRLSNIIKSFNEQFSTLFTDVDRVSKRIQEDIAPKVAADQAYQNAKQNTPNTARLEHDKALTRVMLTLLKDDPRRTNSSCRMNRLRGMCRIWYLI